MGYLKALTIWSCLMLTSVAFKVTPISTRSIAHERGLFSRHLGSATLLPRGGGTKRPASGPTEGNRPAKKAAGAINTLPAAAQAGPMTRSRTKIAAARDGAGAGAAAGAGTGTGVGDSATGGASGGGRADAAARTSPARSPSGNSNRSPLPGSSISGPDPNASFKLSPSRSTSLDHGDARITTYLEGPGKTKLGYSGMSSRVPTQTDVRQRAWGDYQKSRVASKGQGQHMGTSSQGTRVKTSIQAGPNQYTNGYLRGTGAEGPQYMSINPSKKPGDRAEMVATAVRDSTGRVTQPAKIKAEMFNSGKIKSQAHYRESPDADGNFSTNSSPSTSGDSL